MDRDVSKTTLAVLLVLTILVAVLGTWTVLDATLKVKAQTAYSSSGATVEEKTGGGSFAINVQKRNTDIAEGTIALNVVPQSEYKG